MKILKKFTAIILALLMLTAVFPTVYAEGEVQNNIVAVKNENSETFSLTNRIEKTKAYIEKIIDLLKRVFPFLTTYIPGLADKTMLPKEDTKYTADESGSRIANIPYDDYIKKGRVPDGYIEVEGLSESNSAQENSHLIQTVIDEAERNGGGVIYIPEGTYKITMLWLLSNITLYIEKGAQLVSITYNEQNELNIWRAGVITVENAENVKITGGGTINGMGETYTEEPDKDYPLYPLATFNLYTRVIESRKRLREAKSGNRPNLIFMKNCKNVTVDGIILKDSSSWTFQLDSCENVTIHNLVIDNNMHVANTDGIDIMGGSSYDISHCFIATGDDGIVLKSVAGNISDVTVSDCIISSFANCFKIGTETEFDVSDIIVTDCEFFLPDGITGGYSGIAIESADGANISEITVSDIEMTGISSPVLIWLGNRLARGKDKVGSVENILIENVTAKNVELASAVTGVRAGLKTYKVKNVTLRNFDVTYRDSGEWLNIRNIMSESSMSDYPEITRISHFYFLSHEASQYWDLPCYGIFIRHTENVTLENFKCTPRSVNTRDFATLIDTDTIIAP